MVRRVSPRCWVSESSVNSTAVVWLCGYKEMGVHSRARRLVAESGARGKGNDDGGCV